MTKNIICPDSRTFSFLLSYSLGTCTRPKEWSHEKNPAYCWQLYFLWANIEIVNKLRKTKGLNTFAFRPHAGETGNVMHLAASYMLCTSINHGINLDRQVSLQYLYYLDQVSQMFSYEK